LHAPPPTALYTLSLHDALPIFPDHRRALGAQRHERTDRTLRPTHRPVLERVRQTEQEEEDPAIARLAHTRRTERSDDHQHVDVQDRKSTRLNSSHVKISYAVFC